MLRYIVSVLICAYEPYERALVRCLDTLQHDERRWIDTKNMTTLSYGTRGALIGNKVVLW